MTERVKTIEGITVELKPLGALWRAVIHPGDATRAQLSAVRARLSKMPEVESMTTIGREYHSQEGKRKA